jgi:hypothetical protein
MGYKKLKSLKSLGAFDGETNKLDLPRDIPFTKCPHKDAKIVSSSEIRCKCGAAWRDTTPNIIELHRLFTS